MVIVKDKTRDSPDLNILTITFEEIDTLWYPMVIQQNYGKSACLTGKSSN